jgi:hypothetical protein
MIAQGAFRVLYSLSNNKWFTWMFYLSVGYIIIASLAVLGYTIYQFIGLY